MLCRKVSSPGVWDCEEQCERYSARHRICPIVILLSDSSDNGLIGQWGDWLRKSQININTNILYIASSHWPRLVVSLTVMLLDKHVTHQSNIHQPPHYWSTRAAESPARLHTIISSTFYFMFSSNTSLSRL